MRWSSCAAVVFMTARKCFSNSRLDVPAAVAKGDDAFKSQLLHPLDLRPAKCAVGDESVWTPICRCTMRCHFQKGDGAY